ncbi:MAG: enoyl-CoA hydratase [Firmicutes bacterium]|nr:enoyl-CoA hydratase [Bacillota bacterium]
MQYTNILYAVENHIATITLNTPQNLNAFNETMILDVLRALKESEKDDDVHVVVISANGRAFSGGGDVGEMIEGAKKDVVIFDKTVGPISQVSYTIKKMKKPVIASVFGAVAGAAFNIAVACDFCIAAENSKFIQAFVNIGLIPDAGGLFLLTRSLGLNRATHLAMLGTPVTAQEGKDYGFVYQVCPLEELEEATKRLAHKLAHGPLVSYGYMKELIFESQFKGYDEYTALECEKQMACGYTEDFKEGVFAFGEKRKANFTGK